MRTNQLDDACNRPARRGGRASDGQYVYWSDTTDQTISRIPGTGGATLVLAQSQSDPVRIAVDDTYVYWSNRLGGAVMRTLKDGTGVPEVASTASTPYGLVLDAQYVYWTNLGDQTVRQAPKGANSTSVVLASFGDGGATVTGELFTDGTALFATGNNMGLDMVWRLSKTGGGVTAFAANYPGLVTAAGDSNHFAVTWVSAESSWVQLYDSTTGVLLVNYVAFPFIYPLTQSPSRRRLQRIPAESTEAAFCRTRPE